MEVIIKIKEWKDMEKEFGLNEFGDIACHSQFVKGMEHLCGTIHEVWLDNDGGTFIDKWTISKDMYSIVGTHTTE